MLPSRAASRAGVTIKALRYYEQKGLVTPERTTNGYRDYSERDVRLVTEIRALMALGMAPQETRPFLECLRTGHTTGDDCPESLAAYQNKIDRLDDLIAHLTKDRRELAFHMFSAARRGFDGHAREVDNRLLTAPDVLPRDLPVPEDDGAARHLVGMEIPPLILASTTGTPARLNVDEGRWILYIYPMTGEPGIDVPRGWDEIPGARGCSQEACSFRDNFTSLRRLGVQRVFGLSSDQSEYQKELVTRLGLPYPMLSDPKLELAEALRLPTFEAEGITLYKRLTLVVTGSTVEHVFYPVFPPDTHAEAVLDWVAENPNLEGQMWTAQSR